jgi:hypothetical protein
MIKQTRRRFFRTAGMGLAGMAVMPGSLEATGTAVRMSGFGDAEIGIASNGLRNLSLDEVIAFMNDLQLSKI